MKILAVSNYPNDFNDGKIRPSLISKGATEVRFVTSTQLREIDRVSDVEAIVCFYDLMSHGHSELAKSVAKKSGKKFVLLSRKTAIWPENLLSGLNSEKEEEMGTPRSVEPDQIIKLIECYIALEKEGKTDEEKVEHLKHFWTNRPLVTGRQVYKYMYNLAHGNECPAWFKEYYFNRGKIQNVAIPVVEEVSEQKITENSGDSEQESDSGSNVDYLNQLIKEYETEIQALKERVSVLEPKCRMLEESNEKKRETIKSLEGQLLNARKDPAVKEAFVAIKKLVELGLMDLREGMNKLEVII
jgi:hypothetical protein